MRPIYSKADIMKSSVIYSAADWSDYSADLLLNVVVIQISPVMKTTNMLQ